MCPHGADGILSARALLRRQFRLAHELLDLTIEGLDPEALDRCEAGAAARAGAGYARVVVCEDLSVNGVLAAGTPLALSSWAARTGLSELPPLAGPTDWRAWARRVRLDLAELRAYARAVYASTDAYIAALPDEALDPARGEMRACLLDALLLTVSMRRGEIACLLATERRPAAGETRE
jgi:hypothetical protein